MVTQRVLLPLFVAGSLVSVNVGVRANEQAAAGRVVVVHGGTSVLHEHKLLPLKRGDVVYQGDEVETADDGGVRILMQDNSVLDIAANSDMRLDVFAYAPKAQSRLAKITMLIGKLWARVTPGVGGQEDYAVATPNAVAGIRGTSLVVDVSGTGNTQVTVVNGSVNVRDKMGGSQTLGALMQSTVNNKGQTVNHNVPPHVIQGFRGSTQFKSALSADGSSGRLQVANTLVNPGGPSGRYAGPPTSTPHSTGGTTNGVTTTAPPIDLDPSKNLATVTVQVHVKE